MDPDEALTHDWILEGLPDNIRKNFLREDSKVLTPTNHDQSRGILPPIDKENDTQSNTNNIKKNELSQSEAIQ